MKRLRVRLALAAAAAGAVAIAIVTVAAAGGGHSLREKLTGYQETPALSTTGVGKFRASINRGANEIRYQLTYGGLESPATQSHIHFENRTNAGPIVVFLCTNLGNGPAGTQACPPNGGTIHLEGVDIAGLTPNRICHKGIARTFQIPRPFRNLTVVENVALSALSMLIAFGLGTSVQGRPT